jgi:acyl carrier protein
MIDPAAFLSLLKTAFPEPPEDLGLESVLRDMPGWDSLTSVMLVADIFSEYGVQVSGEEMSQCLTSADLLRAIESKL